MIRPVPADRRTAILFDLDGTLVDTVPFILAAVRHAFEGQARCPSDAEWIAGIGTPLRAQLEQFAERPEQVEVLLARYRAFWLAEHDRRTRCFPGALEVVAGLARRGHPLGVVTAKVEEGAFRTLRLTGLDVHMGAVIGAVALTALPEIFRGLADYRYLFYGLTLLLLIRFRPQGVMGSE